VAFERRDLLALAHVVDHHRVVVSASVKHVVHLATEMPKIDGCYGALLSDCGSGASVAQAHISCGMWQGV
jgi:hypothetical protein